MRTVIFVAAVIAIAGAMAAACGQTTARGVYGYANDGYGVGHSARITRHKCYDCIQYRQDGNPSQ